MTWTNSDSPHPSGGRVVGAIHTDLVSIRDSHIYLLISLVACVIYAKSIVYQYTYFDDIYLLVVNQEFLSNPSNILKLFTTDVFISVTDPQVFYRPLMNLLFMFEMQILKDSVVIFHITNIILHIGCSLLLFVLFKQLKLSRHIAAAAALLFCAHPLNTSAVVWIPGRNDMLLTLLVLASFSMFLRALDTKRTWPMVGHMIFFFLALLTKETAFALPILIPMYVFFIRRESPPRTTIFSAGVTYLGLVGVWLGLRSMVTRTYEVHQSLAAVAMSWLNNVPAFVLYAGKAFLPFNLSIFPNLADQSLILGAVFLLLFGVAYALDRPASSRQLIWGLGWFFLFLAPTFLSGNIFHEHRSYCALVGLLFAVAQLPLIQKVDFARPVHVLGLVAVLAVFGVIAMVHSEHFRNRTAYATSAFLSSPSIDESYSALAGLYLDEGNYAPAERVLRAGIARNPAMKALHRMLGDVYANRHAYALAANEYETSIRFEPLQLYTYINYGKMCLEVHRLDDAARLWKRSVFLNPEFLLGYEYLANFYIYTKNDPDSAMIYARQIQQRGVEVMPELLRAIEENPLYGKRKQ
jgi:protein O-mannosyl-transferase